MRKLLVVCTLIFLFSFFPAYAEWESGEVLIRFSPSVLQETDNGHLALAMSIEKDILRRGANSIKPVFPVVKAYADSELDRWFLITCESDISENQLLSSIESLPFVEAAHLNYYLFPDTIPNDPDYDKQYAWDLMEAPTAWDLIKGNLAVPVAIIDSGTDLDHEDLSAAIWTNTGEIPGNGIDDDGNGYIDDTTGWDFAGNDNNPDNVNADNDHGTHVAGIVGAVSNNGVGVAGGTWGCSLMILKVFPDSGGGATVTNVSSAIRYAADNGAFVANLSLGNTQYTQIQADAVLYAYNAGVAVVASSGNGGNDGIGDSSPHYPSAHEGAIGVGSTNRFDSKDGSSNYGEEWVDVHAPGVAIRSTMPGNQYANLSGTSMASPVAAALAALIVCQNPGITPDQIQERMQLGCESIDFANPSYMGELDPGRINYYFSLANSPVVRVQSWNVDDSSGNQNREADAGETVNLNLYLTNKSWMDAANVSVTITAGAGVTINSGTSSYGSIPNKVTALNASDLTLTVTETAKTIIPITVDVTADGGYSEAIEFDLSVNNPIPQMPGFPVPSFGGFNASARAVDLNNDGLLEVITASNDGTISVLQHDGTNFPGWPRNIGSKNHMYSMLILSAPSVADIDQDGTLEIIVADRMRQVDFNNPSNPDLGTKERSVGRIHVFNHDGTDFGGSWPFVTDVAFTPSGSTPIDAGFRASPTIADVTGDSRLEIIAGNYIDNFYVFDHLGNIRPGWPIDLGTDIFGSAAVSDFNGDGKGEIVVATKADVEPLNTGEIYLFDGSGTILPGFPVAAPNQVYSVPVVADLDADGIPEIIYGYGDYANESGPKGVMVINMLGMPLPGWPVAVPDSIYGTPGLGDLDQDGHLEIVVCTLGAEVIALKHDGTSLPGFPVQLSADPNANVNSSPAIADINNNGSPEILVCSDLGYQQDAFLNILHADGTPFPNTPLLLNQNGFSSPCIGDIDNDGDPEIIVTDSGSAVFNVNSTFNSDQQYWPTYHGNDASTGVSSHETPLETGISLMITDTMFSDNEVFSLDVVMTNAETTPWQNVDVFVILDVYSMYWFYPSWSETADWLDYNLLVPGATLMNVFTFTWPTGIEGSADNLFFWGGMLDQNAQLLGRIGFVTFGYGQ